MYIENRPVLYIFRFSNFENRNSALIKLDDVIEIQVSDFCDHVYDLQEDSGFLIANNIIVSNCLCTVRTVLIDNEGNYIEA